VAQPVQPYRNFLSLEAIVAEARAVAAADGLDAVSMRVLAGRLGCTPRALYRHVSGKDEVLELLADSELAEVPMARLDLPWPDALCEFFTAMRARLVAAPAVAQVVAQQAVAGPWFRRHADHLTGLLLDAGLEPETAVEAVVALAQFTLGAALPGTGQRLHDTYREREADLAREGLPALGHVTRHFAGGDAEARFRSALRRLVRAYETGG
jgi:AcrR family transcriptional regulator